MIPRHITEPNYFRAGNNLSETDIPPMRFVKQGTDPDEVEVAAAATDPIVGVTVETIYAGKSQSYQVQGRCPVIAGGTVDVGDYVTSDDEGKAVVATFTQLVKGQAKTAGGADDSIDIELFPGVAWLPADPG